MTDPTQVNASSDEPITRERYDALARAFDYLLGTMPCACGQPNQINVVHDHPCPIAIAINLASEFRKT